MDWRGRRTSSNVDDRRSQRTNVPGRTGRSAPRGMGIPFPMSGRMLMIVVVIGVLYMLFSGGGGMMNLPGIQSQSPTQTPVGSDDDAQFASTVLAMTEDVWNEVFRREGYRYVEPQMVLFSGTTQSGCGFASAQTGPFYCPPDNSIYLDLTFFRDLAQRFQAPGEFARAYVIAHEVGHHIQNLLGITDEMQALRSRVSQAEYNQYSVRLELQADYLAGVFAHHIQGEGILEEGDIEAALRAASAIGDDRIQKETQGRVSPDSFTHGTSEQRMRWFLKGFQSGDLSDGDTFSIPYREL